MRLIILLSLLLVGSAALPQCVNLGQTPPTAFPVCGITTFLQSSVPLCSTTDLYVPGCSGDGALYANKNPYWYKFTCYQSGTLGFTITPLAANEDYDWQLYDVTGLDPNSVFTNHNIIVTGNWSGSYGTTGAAAGGANFIQCASNPATQNTPRFAAMPHLIQGHNYLLMVSHFTDTQSGYSLSFGGGTAVITDPLDPHLLSANAPCDGTEIVVALNKNMRCSSLAPDGSDFYVMTAAGATLIPSSASSAQCSGFDMDTLSVFMPAPLPPGTYTLHVKKGTDANTLKDDCDREVPENEGETFTVYPLFPTPLDSLVKPGCAPQSLQLVFTKRIKCSSIDPAGGDFNITGSYPVSIAGAVGNCDRDGLTQTITVLLAAPLQVHGNFQLHLAAGPDGNTIIDECGVETLPAAISFSVKDTVNADFGYSVAYSCTGDVVSFSHNGANTVNSWTWSFPGGFPAQSAAQNPHVIYSNFLPKQVALTVSNGVCADTATTQLVFANYLKADFYVAPLICPNEPASFTNNTRGTITEWHWDFGNGNFSNAEHPAPQVYMPLADDDYVATPQLIVKNNFGCYDTARLPVKVVYSCFIAVPSAFTPNGDGLNDYLYPLKAYKSTALNFTVYNRFGQVVFHSTDWQTKWDGTFHGQPQDPGTYVWTLQYSNADTGKKIFQKGTTILIR